MQRNNAKLTPLIALIQKKVSQRACLLLLVAGAAVGMQNSAQSNPVDREQSMEIPDPIFGIGYDAHKVHFKLLETRTLLPSCKKMLSDINPLPRVMTLYAKYTSGSTSIYIVGQSDNEKILVLRNGVCDSGVPLLSITQTHHNPPLVSDAPVLTDEEVMGLFEDTLARHTNAFGGKDAFIKWLDMTSEDARSGCKSLPDLWCPPTYHTLQPALQDALKNYREN